MRTLGIDLGTTNTVAAVTGQVIPIPGTAAEDPILPSVIAYLPDGSVRLGGEARRRRPFDPRNTLASTKRVIGVPFGTERARRFAEHHPAYRLVAGAEGHVGFETRAGVITPVQVAERLLARVVDAAAVESATTNLVVTVPAAFGRGEREATLVAARNAGFREPHTVDEPVATAVAYLQRANLRHAVVYDLGGGTFDVAVVDCSIRPFRVVGFGGDPYLGGDDIDHALAERVAARVLRESGWDLRTDPIAWERLVDACEWAKVALADEPFTTISVAEVDDAAPTGIATVTISRDELVGLTLELARKTFVHCDEALTMAGIHARDVQAVFLAGGSSKLPGLKDLVGQYFGKRPRMDIDPMHVVAIGASLAATRPELSVILQSGAYSV
ncbi:MAG: Hsp70 family protein [Polyangiales bacterium]